MKKLLYCAAALAVAFFAGSCQQEKLEPVAESNVVTFTVEAPAGIQTKAKIADGLNVDELIYEVWLTETLGVLDNKAQKLYQGKTTMQVVDGVNKATLTLDLVNDQKFTILFWAQVKDTGVYDTEELNAVTYTKAANLENAYAANDERLAAFYGVAYVKDTYHVTKEEAYTSGTVTLRRPFAQINLGTLNTSTAYTVVMEKSNMIVTVPTVFNVVNSEVSDEKEMTFLMHDVPSGDDEKLKVNDKEYWYAGMNYVFAPKNVVSVEYNILTKLNGGMEATVNNTVPSVPLKENYRTNIIGNLLTSKTDYEIIVDAAFNEPSEEVYVTDVYDNTSLETALRVRDENIVINLAGKEVTKASVVPVEYTVNISSTVEQYYFGGPDTKSITINANGNKINFIHNDGDWNYIRCVNEEAKWVINDAILTNSGKNDGPWNRHDIRFYNAVELNNVTSDKAIALLNDGKLNNVTISEETGAYCLWITADGQSVDIDGLNVTATNDGRGIAIKDQYVENPALVKLNVKNAKFTTASKAAVLVTSNAGAEIVWGNGNNIEAVAADKINAVWVDDARSDYYDEVAVTGATKRLESAVALNDGFYKVSETEYAINSLTGFKAFAASVNNGTTYKGATVKLEADIDLQSEPWTPIGMNADSNKKFYGTFDGQNHTISKLRVGTSYGYADGYTAAGLFGALNGTAKNFTLDGVYVSHISTGNATTNGVAAVAGSIYNKGAIDNVTVRNANVYGNRYLGIIAGYVYGSITNCTVEDVNLKATPNKLANGSYDNGDKVGAIAGYFASESVYKIENNTVSGFDIRGYRDCGAIVGAGNAEVVKNNTATNGSVAADQTINFYEDKDFNVDYIVGRKMSGTVDSSNTSSNVELTTVAYVMDDINEALSSGTDYTFTEDVKGSAVESNGYGATGINQLNGGVIDGKGHTLEVAANGTWGSAINTTGGTIKNLTVAKGFRGIFVNHNSDNCSKVYLENVIIDGTTYTISCDQGTNNGLEAVGSTFNGWTSYAATIGDVKFTDCNFGEGAGNAYCRPYAPTEFVGCAFEAGYVLDACAEVTFKNCTLGGVALTAANISELVIYGINNVVSVDGSEQFTAGAWKDKEGNYTATTSAGIGEIIKAGATTINLEKGIYVIPTSAQGKTLTIKGAGADTKIATNNETGSYEGCNYAFDGSTVTFENISINTPSTTYIGYARCKGTYKNCVINGTFTLYDNSVFEDCTFNVSGDVYNVWTWGAPEATFTRCTFNSDGKAMLLYGEVPSTKLTMTDCIFNDNGGLTAKKAAIEIGAHNSCKRELIVTNATVNGYEINDEGINTNTTLWGNKNSMSQELLNVVVDGVDVY